MKIRSHSGAKKRVKITGKGKLIVRRSSKQHLLTNKSKKSKAQAPHGMLVPDVRERRVRRLLAI